ncbi:mycothiol synthase [Nostocoides sp. F2B08]|uniref:mycothiol synthase n=1 Tax=Nostocoides sp. F2B08 TaxID=2653936 RepID=UPI001262AD90|nr:mycothiol synthase [Tetrasphaera sp. F2B08]KAB7745101.1 mycothiol synthase [Tetrasphaera sp. F2B08]
MSARIETRTTLAAAEAETVRELARRAESADGVGALSEASRLALGPDSPAGTTHVLARADSDAAVIGYAQVWPDDSAELVVDPSARRSGAGGALWAAAHAAGAQRVWAHGDLPAARALAEALELTPVRSLLRMGRPLTPDDSSPRPLPNGYAVTTFAVRRTQVPDPLEELRALNAAAFADHPEQGRLTVADLRARTEEPWFEPEGLLYVRDESDRDRGPVAFHWTKIEPGQDGSGAAAPRVGEVYVVGVHPAYQGRGLAGPLTDLGLAHLVSRGCTDVVLYVDGENAAARATYERAGLGVQATDRVYAVVAPEGRAG